MIAILVSLSCNDHHYCFAEMRRINFGSSKLRRIDSYVKFGKEDILPRLVTKNKMKNVFVLSRGGEMNTRKKKKKRKKSVGVKNNKSIRSNKVDQDEKQSNIIEKKVQSIIQKILALSPSAISPMVHDLVRFIEKCSGWKILPRKGSTTNKLTKVLKEEKMKPLKLAKRKFSSSQQHSTHRIQSELKAFMKTPPQHMSVKASSRNIRVWIVTVTCPPNTIFANESYKLKITFPPQYPTIPPSVFFLQPTPRHEHVYTNGDICLSLLGKDWRPTITAQSLALAIFSILCGAKEKSLPIDNSKQAGNKPGQAQDNWIYHDDNC